MLLSSAVPRVLEQTDEWLEESERALDTELEIANDLDQDQDTVNPAQGDDTSPFPCLTHVCY